jgi:hypothetical protein
MGVCGERRIKVEQSRLFNYLLCRFANVKSGRVSIAAGLWIRYGSVPPACERMIGVGGQRVVDNEVHSRPARLVRVVEHGLRHGLVDEIRIHGMRRVDEDYRLPAGELCSRLRAIIDPCAI